MTHGITCPRVADPSAQCTCDFDERAAFAAYRESLPDPADLIRKAQEEGLIKQAVNDYGAAA